MFLTYYYKEETTCEGRKKPLKSHMERFLNMCYLPGTLWWLPSRAMIIYQPHS